MTAFKSNLELASQENGSINIYFLILEIMQKI